jgi:hypothetical protein
MCDRVFQKTTAALSWLENRENPNALCLAGSDASILVAGISSSLCQSKLHLARPVHDP